MKMEQQNLIERIHYIVHPLWSLDNYKEESIKLIEDLIILGENEGQNSNTLFVMFMNNTSKYVNDNKYRVDGISDEELKLVLKDYKMYKKILNAELKNSCKYLYSKEPYVEPFYFPLRRKYDFTSKLSPSFNSFLKTQNLMFANDSKIFGHGIERIACVLDGVENFTQAIENSCNLKCSYEICLETTLSFY